MCFLASSKKRGSSKAKEMPKDEKTQVQKYKFISRVKLTRLMYTALKQKKLFTLLDLCVSSLRRGHANLLCIVPILTDGNPEGNPTSLGND